MSQTVDMESLAGGRRTAAVRWFTRRQLRRAGRLELTRRLAGGDVIVIDVRPAPEYVAGHIAGARSIPIESLQHQLRDLPDDVKVVTYCRGPFCVYADEAVRQLSREGRRARRLEVGFRQWQQAGLSVGVGTQ